MQQLKIIKESPIIELADKVRLMFEKLKDETPEIKEGKDNLGKFTLLKYPKSEIIIYEAGMVRYTNKETYYFASKI